VADALGAQEIAEKLTAKSAQTDVSHLNQMFASCYFGLNITVFDVQE